MFFFISDYLGLKDNDCVMHIILLDIQDQHREYPFGLLQVYLLMSNSIHLIRLVGRDLDIA